MSPTDNTPQLQAKQPRILTLPAEIRNKIYRLATLEPDYVEVDDNYKLPALLHVNRKLRQEARSIYFLEQFFRVVVTGFNCTNYAGFLHTLGGDDFYAKMVAGGQLTLTTSCSRVSWPHLMVWCKAYYEGSMPGCQVITHEARSEAERACSRVFKLVAMLKEKMSWEEVREFLLQYRYGITDAGGEWWGGIDD